MAIIFVYGTLKKGYRNHRLLENSNFIGIGKINGYDMYDLGSFPGIVKGNGEISGELYEIDQDTLKRIDRLEAEGYLYIRQFVNVIKNGKTVKAATYIFNRSVSEMCRIEGEWRNNYD